MPDLPLTDEQATTERDEIVAWFNQANEKNARLNWLNGFLARAGTNGQVDGEET